MEMRWQCVFRGSVFEVCAAPLLCESALAVCVGNVCCESVFELCVVPLCRDPVLAVSPFCAESLC